MSSHYLAYRESECASCSSSGVIVAPLVLLASVSPLFSAAEFNSLVGLGEITRGLQDKQTDPSVDGNEATARERETARVRASLRACANLAPRTTNRGLESGLVRHPVSVMDVEERRHERGETTLPPSDSPHRRGRRVDCAVPSGLCVYRMARSAWKLSKARSIVRP